MKLCKDCRFLFDTFGGVCGRNEVKWAEEQNMKAADKPPKPDYVNGGELPQEKYGYGLSDSPESKAQATRLDVKRCGPDARWFEAKP